MFSFSGSKKGELKNRSHEQTSGTNRPTPCCKLKGDKRKILSSSLSYAIIEIRKARSLALPEHAGGLNVNTNFINPEYFNSEYETFNRTEQTYYSAYRNFISYAKASLPGALTFSSVVMTSVPYAPTFGSVVKTSMSDASTTGSEAKTSVSDASTTGSEAKTSTSDAPTSGSEAKTSVSDAPTSVSDAQTSATYAPTCVSDTQTSATDVSTCVSDAQTCATYAPTFVSAVRFFPIYGGIFHTFYLTSAYFDRFSSFLLKYNFTSVNPPSFRLIGTSAEESVWLKPAWQSKAAGRLRRGNSLLLVIEIGS